MSVQRELLDRLHRVVAWFSIADKHRARSDCHEIGDHFDTSGY